MNKRVLIGVITVLIVIVAAVAYLIITREDSSTPSAQNDMMVGDSPSNTPPVSSPEQNPAAAGSYVSYTDSVVEQTDGTKLLFFFADWCPQCRSLDADIVSGGVPEGVTIIKVDYDSNQALRQKYGVTIQTTIVRVDDDGNLLEKFVAYDNPTVDAVIAELL